MVSKENTHYIIQYDYDLNNAQITIPEGCILDFQGGSLSNGTIVEKNTVIKAVLRKIFELDIKISGSWNVTEAYPEWFGAIGDGVTDDYNSIQKTIDSFNNICISNVYNITTPLIVKLSNRHLYGKGTLKKTTCLELDGINAILILAFKCIVENINFYGTTNNVIGIALYTSSSLSEISNVNITKCTSGIKALYSSFMVKMEKVHCVHCKHGFDFTNDADKTSLTLINCWCENCGQAYDLKKTTYSSLINCGADYCNYVVDSNPYGISYGDKATSKGIYNFTSCYNVSILNCGCEYSYGNGAVRSAGSDLTIYGLTAHGIKSEFIPSYNKYPNWAVGAICTNDSRSTLNIDNVRIGDFENIFVSANYPTKTQSIVAFNYSVQAYGNSNKAMVILGHYLNNSSNKLKVFGGHGYDSDSLLCYSQDSELYVAKKNKIKGYSTKILKSVSPTNKLMIPFKPQGHVNQVGMIEIYGINNTYNDTTGKGFRTLIEFNSLTSVKNVSIIERSSELITATESGLNLIVTLPSYYSNIEISYRIIRSSYVDENNIVLLVE